MDEVCVVILVMFSNILVGMGVSIEKVSHLGNLLNTSVSLRWKCYTIEYIGNFSIRVLKHGPPVNLSNLESY